MVVGTLIALVVLKWLCMVLRGCFVDVGRGMVGVVLVIGASIPLLCARFAVVFVGRGSVDVLGCSYVSLVRCGVLVRMFCSCCPLTSRGREVV